MLARSMCCRSGGCPRGDFCRPDEGQASRRAQNMSELTGLTRVFFLHDSTSALAIRPWIMLAVMLLAGFRGRRRSLCRSRCVHARARGHGRD
jgi:hypothetical protein